MYYDKRAGHDDRLAYLRRMGIENVNSAFVYVREHGGLYYVGVTDNIVDRMPLEQLQLCRAFIPVPIGMNKFDCERQTMQFLERRGLRLLNKISPPGQRDYYVGRA